MKLREYMAAHGGEYTLADGSRPVKLAHLESEWADEEIEVYTMGNDPGGRCKVHLYAHGGTLHILTHVYEREPAHA